MVSTTGQPRRTSSTRTSRCAASGDDHAAGSSAVLVARDGQVPSGRHRVVASFAEV